MGVLAVCISMLGCGSATEEGRLGQSNQPLSTRIFASTPTELEPAIIDVPPSGVFAMASFGTSHMIVMQSHTAESGGYGPRAYVVHDGTVANPEGSGFTTALFTLASLKKLALGTGTHWFYAQGKELFVFNIDGSLKGVEPLPFDAHQIAWADDRALLVGAEQGQFLDERGRPLGDAFDITAAPTLRNGGLAFDGSNFLLEYSTVEGVFAIGISPTGSVGSPVTVRTVAGQPYDYGHGHSLLSDRQGKFLVLYDDFVNSTSLLRYRTATVDSSLGVTLGAEQVANGINPGVGSADFLGGRYVFIDRFRNRALYVSRDGIAQGSFFAWTPWSNAQSYELSASADGGSAVLADFAGLVSRVTANLAIVDNPRLQVGLGPNDLGHGSAAFDGLKFWVSWSDMGRSAIRGAQVGVDGATLAPGPATLATSQNKEPTWLVSNGSSVLHFRHSTRSAVLKNPDGSAVTVDFPMFQEGDTWPSLTSNGDDYLVVSPRNAIGVAVLVSSSGTIERSVEFAAGVSPSATFDGEKYLVAFSGRAGPSSTGLHVMSFSSDSHSRDRQRPGLLPE